jgi:hypothetical protein
MNNKPRRLLMLLTSQMQILCSLEKIYRAEYKYHLLRHISRKRDANPLALFGRSNYQPSRKPFLLYVEAVFRSSFLLFFVNYTTRNVFPIQMLEIINGYQFNFKHTTTRKIIQLQSTMTPKWRMGQKRKTRMNIELH